MSCPSGLVTPENFNTNPKSVNQFFPGSRNYMQEARKAMKLNRLTGMIAAAIPLAAIAAVALVVPLAAEEGRSGQLHILKDCGTFTGVPGSSFCTIVNSNLPELPAGTKIYYDQITAGPTAGTAGYLDSNVFVYISESQWAVGRCTVPNDNKPGLCTLSDGLGPLAGFSARIVVTFKPGGDGALYAWDGPYRFNPMSDR